jgi:hypothetical protein
MRPPNVVAVNSLTVQIDIYPDQQGFHAEASIPGITPRREATGTKATTAATRALTAVLSDVQHWRTQDRSKRVELEARLRAWLLETNALGVAGAVECSTSTLAMTHLGLAEAVDRGEINAEQATAVAMYGELLHASGTTRWSFEHALQTLLDASAPAH